MYFVFYLQNDQSSGGGVGGGGGSSSEASVQASDAALGAASRRGVRAPELPSVQASSSSEATTAGRAGAGASTPSSFARTAVASWRTREEASMCFPTSRASLRTSNGTPFSLSARALAARARRTAFAAASTPRAAPSRPSPSCRTRRRPWYVVCALAPSARATSSSSARVRARTSASRAAPHGAPGASGIFIASLAR